MKKTISFGRALLLAPLLWLAGCASLPPVLQKTFPGKPDQPVNTPSPAAAATSHHASYTAAKTYTVQSREQLGALSKSVKTVEAQGHLFTDLLVNELVPYWIGTPWDFNGTAREPGEGPIACGYFVTTLLQDMGVVLNRVKLAQGASAGIINTLTTSSHITNYNKLSFDEFLNKMEEKGKGVSIVGLDTHAGLLVNDGEDCWFVHSSTNRGVVKEPAADSYSLRKSKTRMLGHITEDPVFLQRWLKG